MEAFIDAIKSLCQWQLSTTWPDNLPSPACLLLCFLFKPVGVRNPYMEAFIDAIKSLCQWQLSTTWPDNLPSPACLPLCFLFKPVGYFLLSSAPIARCQEVTPRRIHTLLCSKPTRLNSIPPSFSYALPPLKAGYLSSRHFTLS